MVYTKARLEHALQVFRETSVDRNQKGIPPENRERHLQSRYGFRRSTKAVALTNISIWHDKSKDDDSNDDEYDPNKEKLRLRRKKKPEKQNKIEDAGGAYLTLRVTTESGKERLTRFVRDEKPSEAIYHNQQDSGEDTEPCNFSRYVSSSRKRRGRRQPEASELRDALFDREFDEELQNLDAYGRTSLRSGKILEKPLAGLSGNDRTDKTLDITPPHDVASSDSSADETRFEIRRARVKHLPKTAIRNRSVNYIGTVENPIELSDDAECSIDKLPVPANHTQRCSSTRHNLCTASHGRVEEEFRSTTTTPDPPPSQPDFTRFKSTALTDSVTITIPTCYAHPIDFRNVTSGFCDFCADWRMGIFGLGLRSVECIVDPDHPYQYLETGGGHRENHESTKMCVSCALKRLMIMRCHNPEDYMTEDEHHLEPGLESIINPNTTAQILPEFATIKNKEWRSEKRQQYQEQLFAQPRPQQAWKSDKNTVFKASPMPICSLCPIPAAWECCTWQKMDMRKNPCSIPNKESNPTSTTNATSNSNVGTVSREAKFSPPASSPSIAQTTNPNSTPSQTMAAREDVIMLDSDSDTDPQLLDPSLAAHVHRLTPSYSQSRSSSISAPKQNKSLRAPIRGCGLTLCQYCHAFVRNECRGLLDKRLIMKWLRGQVSVQMPGKNAMEPDKEVRCKVFGRADVEFLFRGGLLERSLARS